MFCMTGDTVNAPMGTLITIERDQSEFTRLAQLGDILGLNQFEIGSVHQGLSEKAFRSQAEQMLADGSGVTDEKAAKLKEIQTQLQMPDEMAQKIIKGITSNKALGNMQAQISMGTLTVEEIRKMREQGVEIDHAISPEKRMNLFRKNAERRLKDGSGSADITALTKTLPEDLGIDTDKAAKELGKIAADSKKSTMIQAVALLRQKKSEEVIRECRNIVACHQVAPDQKLDWTVESEVLDMYSVFAAAVAEEGERAALSTALGISDETKANLEGVISEGGFELKDNKAVADEALF